jgi:hypothetical protein
MKDFMEIGDTTILTQNTPSGANFYRLKRLSWKEAIKILENGDSVIMDIATKNINGSSTKLTLTNTFLYIIHEIYMRDEDFDIKRAFYKAVVRYALAQKGDDVFGIAFYFKY